MSFGNKIISWYHKNKRDLPWRNTKDPYLIWLSEIILQQTRVDQGLSYYNRFSEKYPHVKKLASAKEDDILKLWQGLGYYSRARNLHTASKQVLNMHGGIFPTRYEDIRNLTGVGDYTAAAIASFAFGLNHAVVDGNVFRLLSRCFGISTAIDTSRGKKEFTFLANKLLQGFPSGIFNQAIMEFGARQCKPANPDCEICPLIAGCYAFKNKSISSLPVKKNKIKSADRYFNYIVIRDKQSFYIKKRIEKDIWQGLHDFPLIETKHKLKESDMLQLKQLREIFSGRKFKLIRASDEYKHVLSHQKIHAKFYEIEAGNKILSEQKGAWTKVNSSSVKKFAVPRLIERYLESL